MVTNRKPVRDFQLLISTRHPIFYRFEVIADYCSNFGHFAFLSHPLGAGEHRSSIHRSSWLIGKRVVNFLFVLIELFSLGVTAEALRPKIGRKSLFCKGVSELRPNFRV